MSELPAGFHRAEQDWLYNTPENTPDYDEWCDGRREIRSLLYKYSEIINGLPCEPDNAQEARDYLNKLIQETEKLTELVDELEKLEEQFPPKYEEPDF